MTGSVPTLRIGEWQVFPELHRVEGPTGPAQLEPKAMRVLVCLAERAPSVVPRESLIKEVWEGAFVTDDVLTHAVSELRRLFNDTTREPRYIQTIPKSGYRLIAPVEWLSASEAADAQVNGSKAFFPALKWALPLAAFVLALAVFFVVSHLRPRAGTVPKRTLLAVLPLENISSDAEQEYFSDGMTDELITCLGSVNPERLGVIGRTSVMRYKGGRPATEKIGQELGVDYIMEGSVRREAGTVRITARLVQVKDQTQIWSQAYQGELSRVLDLQNRVARSVAEGIGVALDGRDRATRRRPIQPAAFDAYLKGCNLLLQHQSRSWDKAREYFEHALTLDPQFALAYSGLARYYLLSPWFGVLEPRVAYPKAKEAAQEALRLDETLSEAHTSLAGALAAYDWDLSAAEREYRRGLELNPSSAVARKGYSVFLATEGRFEEALREAGLAEAIEPSEPAWVSHKGWIHMLAGQLDLALEQCRKAVSMDPNRAGSHMDLGAVYLEKGMRREALAELEKARSLSPDNVLIRNLLARAYAELGEPARTQKILQELLDLARKRFVPPRLIAEIYQALGDGDRALVWYKKMFEERDPWVRSVRSRARRNLDARMDAKLREIGFP